MSSVVIELQRDTLNKKVLTSDLLRKALVVSKKLKIKEFESWVANELNGYKKIEDIPNYRHIKGDVKAWNPYHGWQPVYFQDHKKADFFSIGRCGQAIAEIESLIDGKSDTPSLQMPFPAELNQHLRQAINFDTPITLIVSFTNLIRIIDAVRTIILNWSLKLEENGILGEGLSFTANEKKAAEKTSYNIINFYAPVQGQQIQQDSVNATQISSLYQFDSDMVKKILDGVKNHIKDLNVGSETEQELKAEIKTVEVQINSPKPKHGIIKESLMSIKTILEGAGGSVAAQLLLQLGSLF